MKTNNKGKLNIHSIIFKFLFVFLLFGCLLVMITVSIQNDFSRTTIEKLTESNEQQSILTLEKNLGDGYWNVRDSFLYKGETPVGNGSYENAFVSPFTRTEDETGSFVYCFMSSSLAHEAVLKQADFEGRERTDFIRVSGSALDEEGLPIVGSFLDKEICDALNKDGVYSGRSLVEGRQYY
ncbi:MAG: hypothetical protein KBT31_01510, partial [Firmicutes bacterium]|nr:hypothetical protein [Candidatus Colimorpha enterica]